jgi:hypothetical protein
LDSSTLKRIEYWFTLFISKFGNDELVPVNQLFYVFMQEEEKIPPSTNRIFYACTLTIYICQVDLSYSLGTYMYISLFLLLLCLGYRVRLRIEHSLQCSPVKSLEYLW